MATYPDMATSRTICVSGMHRSGTSLAARLVQILGVSLGSGDALLDPGPDNTAGYWENAAIKELDDEILAALGGSWDQPPPLSPGWEHSPKLDEHRSRARDALALAFGDAPAAVVGFKDPRLSIVLPFWRTIVDIDTTIVLVRDPVEVAGSLAARNGFSSSQASLLWLRYLFAATDNDPGHLLMTQTEIFEDMTGSLSRIAAHLGLEAPTPEQVAGAASHLDPELRHHTSPASRELQTDPIAQLAETVWNGGSVRLDALPGEVRLALAQGWLRDPGDGEQLAASRAQVVALTEEIRRRNRERDAMISTRLRLRVRQARRWVHERSGR